MTYPWLTFHTSPDDQRLLIDGEKTWEMEGIQRGIDRARRLIEDASHRAVSNSTGGLADLDAGAIIMHEIIKPLIPAIEELQDTAIAGINTVGRNARWWLPLLSLEAEKWAVITVRTVLTGLAPETKDSRPCTPLAIQIAKHGKLQREFDLWKKAEAEARKESDGDYVDLYRLMISRVKEVNPRTAKKWMKLSANVDRLEWSKDDLTHVGMRLLETLVSRGGGWFEMKLVGKGGGATRITERRLALTPIARDWIRSRHAQTELQRPFLAPMLTPPDPWRWEPGGQGRKDPEVSTEGREGQDEVQQEKEDT